MGNSCPAETPEGPNCGLVKNLGLIANISVGTAERNVENVLLDLGVIPLGEESTQVREATKVFLNGKLIGIHTQYIQSRYNMAKSAEWAR